ncbi:MAG: O-antigen ligase family protein [Candidatus Cryptobacteroides sp.]
MADCHGYNAGKGYMGLKIDGIKLNFLLLVCIALLAGLEVLSSVVNDVDFANLVLADIAPYILLFCVVWTLASYTGGKVLEKFIIAAASAALICETVTGFFQLAGKVTSGNFYYHLTGSFRNPGPYGGFIAVLLCLTLPEALKFRRDKSLSHNALPLLAGLASILGIVVLPATLSRTAFAAFGVAALLYIVRLEVVKAFVRRRKWIVVAAAAVLAVSAVVLFNFKKESADGRLHIWKIETLAMAGEPLLGYGPGMALGAYGDTQEAYFRNTRTTQAEIRAAGVPQFAFNEYLRFGMECGVPGLLLSLAVVISAAISLHRKDTHLEYALVALGVFAIASYPLSLWQFRLVLVVLLGFAAAFGSRAMAIPATFLSIVAAVLLVLSASTLRSVREASQYSRSAKLGIALGSNKYNSDSLATRLPFLKNDAGFLYDYATILRREGRFEESAEMALRGAGISPDPLFNTLAGQNYASLGRYQEAGEQYTIAYFKVPCRIGPLFRMMEMRLSVGDDKGALEFAERIARMPVNRKVRSMVTMKSRAVEVRDSLSAAIIKE